MATPTTTSSSTYNTLHNSHSPSPQPSPSASTSAVVVESCSSWPIATEEASATFTTLTESTYQSKQLGSVTYYDEHEAICDCSFEAGHCDESSQCMNRLLQIECLPSQCRAGNRCQNQRFQKREYAKIEIVKTDLKGFGVRAAESLAADAFVYEYVGEVIGPSVFQKRISSYAKEGIKHFYFMALDRDVFIDATRKGGFGRFLNHSCQPNCTVAKWSVGNKQRMGIFTKRDIQKGEELTFNYNVDRYGHDAQECFCGEPNCVGWIGGNTQTDLAGIDQLYLDALGLNDHVVAVEPKSKKKRSKKLDEVDESVLLEPVTEEQVPKVSAALRQAIKSPMILSKVLTRINQTTDESVQLALLRLHGFSLMKHILVEYPDNHDLVHLVLSILLKWPLIVKNKVDASRIEPIVNSFTTIDHAGVSELASALIDYWSTLSLGYRIPKQDSASIAKRKIQLPPIDHLPKRLKPDSPSPITHPLRPVFVKPEATVSVPSPSLNSPGPGPGPALPPGWRLHRDPQGRAYYENSYNQQVQWSVPTTPAELLPSSRTSVDVSSIVAKVQREAEQARKDHPPPSPSPQAQAHAQAQPVSRDKDKRVLQLFSSVVVSVMSHYRHEFEGDQFKRRAREVTELLCDKERKHPTYATNDYDKLSQDKINKLKAFVKQWLTKLLDRKRKNSKPQSFP